MRGHLLSLCGFGGAGKDVLADHLIRELGYVRHNYGDLIKAFYDPFLSGEESVYELTVRLLSQANEDLPLDEIYSFVDSTLVPYKLAGHCISAFTEDRAVKHHIRPVLERGGELIYHWVQRRYNERLEELLASGQHVINTRMCALSEAENSRLRDGYVVEIRRENWEPATEWDARTLRDLRRAGHIHETILNTGRTAEDWEAQSRNHAYSLHYRLARKERTAA